MLNRLIHWAIANRLLVVAGSALLLIYGGLAISKMPVDVFPDLNRPTVTIMSEAEGLAPEEVESLVTFPLESALNGATGVERVRSVSGIGLSIVWVEFGWDTEIYTARQIVTEKLSSAKEILPDDVDPVMTPISSIMGEVMLLAVSSRTGELSPMALRTLADWQIRPRLLSVPGVSQVTVIGGEVRQYQVLADPGKLTQYDITLDQLTKAVANSNQATSGGFLEEGGLEELVRNMGRLESLEELGEVVIDLRESQPIRVKDVARAVYGARPRRGDASFNGSPAVILSIQKQPTANTVELTEELKKAVAEAGKTLPADLVVEPLFEQSAFIEASVSNVEQALLDGAIMVAIVLFLFLLNVRTTVITLTAIPLSFVVAGLTMNAFGLSINTMTLGGLAVAIGELVDDAIVDVENVFRRLRENRAAGSPRNPFEVVFEASSEVRTSIVYSTMLIALVFMPLFFLGGIEGRLFQPLAVAYIVSLLASLVISLSVTPAMCCYLLVPSIQGGEEKGDSPLVRWLKAIQTAVLRFTLKHAWPTLGLVALLFATAMFALSGMGREFLPPFNEGTITLTLVAQPGTSLEESNRIGNATENLLMQVPEVSKVGRRTGRAELDEHAEGVHYSEIDVDLVEGRPREAILTEIRGKLRDLPGVEINLGQPISHRLDHMLSGVRAQIAIKIFGSDLAELRRLASEVRDSAGHIPGVVDLTIEKQVLLPQLQNKFDKETAGRYGLTSVDLTETLELALGGKTVGQILEGQRVFDLVVRLDEPFRGRPEVIKGLLIDTPTGKIPLGDVAKVEEARGPNQIFRESVERRIVISANVQERDLGTVVEELKAAIEKIKLPPGYYVVFGGQFESQESATKVLLGLSFLSGAAIFLLLYMHFKMARLAFMVMAALPLSLIGGTVGVFLTGNTLSVASLIGFITLTGIASRNEIMRLSHYLHLMEHEGEEFGIDLVLRGSNERMVPVLMTALTAMLALVPLAISAGVPGKEILHPVAVVILCGLASSTILDTVVTPVLFYRFGAPVWERMKKEKKEELQ